MTLGKDILYVAQNLFGFSTAIHEAVFTGVPNNGLVTVPIGASGTSNLLEILIPQLLMPIYF
jgi:hypothetical protein